MLTYDIFSKNCERLLESVRQACAQCGRDPATVKILPVTKTHSAESVRFAKTYGFEAVGENRVQEAVDKKANCDATVRWELIGHLQSNKARLAVQCFDRIQSVDSIKLASKLDVTADELGKVLPILVQVNAGDDPAKHGLNCADASAMLDAVLAMKHLKVEGLMTIAPLDDDIAVAQRTFERLRTLRDSLAEKFSVDLPELSMGMSGDMEVAVKAGSTMIRVGTALFGSR